jgi:hypothetical protein
VPAIEDALRELDLLPLHDALRAGDTQRALAAAADRLGVDTPAASAGARDDDARTIARTVDDLVAAGRPELARGKWIYEWLVDRVWPEADLIAIELDLDPRDATAARDGKRSAELLADDRFRRAIGVNEHEGVAWFSQERFDRAVTWLALPNGAQLKRAAKSSGYRLDKLAQLLSEPASAPATRAAKGAPRRAEARSAPQKTAAATTKRSKK